MKQKKLTSVTSIGMTVQSKLKINWNGETRENVNAHQLPTSQDPEDVRCSIGRGS